jgi:hypothetical protein
LPAEIRVEEKESASEVGRDRLPAERREREQERRDDERVRQNQEDIRIEIGPGPERPDEIGFRARDQRGEHEADRHGNQDQQVEDERREKSAPQIVGLADWSGIEERVHSSLYVPRSRIAGQRRGDQQSDHAAEGGDSRDDERRIQEEAAAARVVDGFLRPHHVRESQHDREIEPRRNAWQLLPDFKTEDFPELHRATSPAMVLK